MRTQPTTTARCCHTSLIGGRQGVARVEHCDYDDLLDQDPYRHHPFEMHFGLTDRTGKPKPQLAEIARFSRLVADLDETGWEPIAARWRSWYREHFERVLYFTTVDYRKDNRDNLLQAYIAAREADLPVTFVRELDGLGERAKLFLLPSAKLLHGSEAAHLVELAEGGATVYLSYFAGSAPSQIGSLGAVARGALRGPPPAALRASRPDRGRRGGVQLRRGRRRSHTWRRAPFSGGGPPRARAPSCRSSLPAPTVLAVDGHGRPALLRRKVAMEPMVLCTYPVRAHGRRVHLGSTGEHVALVLGARHLGRRRSSTDSSRPEGDQQAASAPPSASWQCSSTPRRIRSR